MNTRWEDEGNEVVKFKKCLEEKYEEPGLAKLPDTILANALARAEKQRQKALKLGHSIHTFGRATEILRREQAASCRADG